VDKQGSEIWGPWPTQAPLEAPLDPSLVQFILKLDEMLLHEMVKYRSSFALQLGLHVNMTSATIS